MKIEIKTRYIILLILALLGASFITGGILGHRRADRASTGLISDLDKQINRYVVELDKKTAYVTSVEQELKTLKQAKQDGDVTSQNLRKLNIKTLNELTKAKLTINILRDSVAHNGTVTTIHDTTTINNGKNCIILPFSFADSSQYVNLWGSFDTKGVMSYGINVPINVDLYTGIDKTTKKPIANLTIDNPYVTLNSIQSIKLDLPKPKKYGIGIQIGYGVSLGNPLRSSPYIGIGFSFNPVRF